MFCQSVATGLRSAIKTVSMADVLEVLKKESENNMRFKRNGKIFNGNLPTDDKALKFEKLTQSQKEKLRGYSPQISPIISLAARYAKFTDFDCKLPPDLMAGVLKYLILNLKRENIRKKKVDIVKERKLRRRNIKANFIKSMKPFQLSQKTENNKETLENSKPEPVRDEPYPGPDLYIVLIDFYNPLHFTELLRINVPFLALLKISNFREIKTDSLHKAVAKKTESFNKKEHLVSDFWRVLTENCETLENTTKFKDFMLMEYQPQYSRLTESKRFVNDIIFDEISWILYNAYMVHRQHQTYLQEMVVQRTFVSLETLNLSECTIYNQLCDALVTGAPNTVLLILYAMVEQVICGVPLTESAPLEYKPANADYFLKTSNINDFLANYYQDLKKRKNIIPTSCLECRCKQHPGELCIHSVEDILEKSEG